jgi:hypothetical protein
MLSPVVRCLGLNTSGTDTESGEVLPGGKQTVTIKIDFYDTIHEDIMLSSQIVSLISILLALAAACIAIWQVRVSTRSAEKANALPIISQVFEQSRSPQFDAAIRRLLGAEKRYFLRRNFDALPRSYRRDAYRVCYFFDYLGTLVLYDIVAADVIIGVLASRLVQVWITMKPLIYNERGYRADTYPAGAPQGFLVYYEYLIKLIEEGGQRDAARLAQERAGLRHLEMGKARKRGFRRK